LDNKAKEHQISAYRRIRTLLEVKEILDLGASKGLPLGVLAGFNIVTQDWYDASNGIIPLSDSSSILDNAHAVTIEKYNDETQQLYFWNSWGATWGERGYGYLPYEYFDKHMTDAWTMYPTKDQYPMEWSTPFIVLEWGRSYFGDVLLHGIEVYELATIERVGWSFARATDGFLDVEEFFVKPNYRWKGHAKRIRNSLVKLATRLKLPLRFWIAHPDVRYLEAMEKLVAPIGLKIWPSARKCASYVAIDAPDNHLPKHNSLPRQPLQLPALHIPVSSVSTATAATTSYGFQ
jgi:GNAT superfamily N-acetyltransferase